MATIDSFNDHLSCNDTKKKLDAGAKIIEFLNDDTNTLESDCFSAFVEVAAHTIANNNFKVAQNGLDIFTILAGRMKDGLKTHLTSFLPQTIDRLGDQKDAVREQAKVLLRKLMTDVSTPQIILEKLLPAFNHKNWRVRDETINFLRECLPRFGVVGSTNGQLYVSKFVPVLIGLMSDQNPTVRDNSVNALVDLYKHVGDRLRKEIQNKQSDMPAVKMQLLMSKFDEVANRGEVIMTNGTTNTNGYSNSPALNNGRVPRSTNISNFDDTDATKKSTSKRAISAPPVKRNVAPVSAAGSGGVAGAADEEMFMQAFEDPAQVPRVQLFSIKDLEFELSKIIKVCADQSQDWEKRTVCLRRFRALIVAGALNYDEFYQEFRALQDPFLTSIKDLRSQVVREACITIAYLSQKTENKCDKLMEFLLPTLIGQIQNSAKIMSSSATVAVRFLIQHTHYSRLIPLITMNFTSKSREIRRACCEFLSQLLHTWSVPVLEKHIGKLQDAIRKGLSDPDNEARQLSRKAFWSFSLKFKPESDYLLSQLDPSKRKHLNQDQMSNWSSNNSLNQAPSSMTAGKSSYSSRQNSVENIDSKFGTASRRIPPPTASKPVGYKTPLRTSSAIDLNAQRSAKAKVNSYLGTQPKPVMTTSVFSTLNFSKRVPQASVPSHIVEPRTPTQARGRVSKSQPGSRSQSPSRHYYSNIGVAPPPRSTQKSSKYGTPSSTASRDSSPHSTYRTPTKPVYERRLSSTSCSRSTASAKRSTTSRILTPNDERKIANSLMQHVTPRRKYHMDDQSDDGSENSSICSDMSFSAFNGRRLESTARIIEKLQSQVWNDRKEGLANLMAVFRDSQSCRDLTTQELKDISDVFHRMLGDQGVKSYSFFLGVLNEFIQIYAKQLHHWLYPLMTRLFLKLGNDILNSIQTRILKTLELIRECFPIVNQFNAIMRLLSDGRHSMNNKARVATLQHLSKIIFRMEAIDFTYDRPKNHEIAASLQRIIYSTADKSNELRKISEETIIDLYHLNDTQMMIYINSLDSMYQEAARQIIESGQKRKSSIKAPQQTPCTYKMKPRSADTHTMNPDQYLDTLKKTTSEIQSFSLNYSEFNSSNGNGMLSLMKRIQNDDSHWLTASMDSGISQIDGLKNGAQNGNGTPSSTNGRSPQSCRLSNGSTLLNDTVPAHEISGIDALKSFIVNPHQSADEQLQEISNVVDSLSMGDVICVDLLNTILEQLICEQNSSRKVSLLQALNSVIVKSAIDEPKLQIKCINALLETGKDADKDVIKTMDITTTLVAGKFDPKAVFENLAQVVNSDNHALSVGALRLLTRLIEHHKHHTANLMPQLIPHLLKSYESAESQVRKATVFCLVAVHTAIGDRVYELLESLSSTKMKLLKLYIERSKKPENDTHS